VYKMKSLYGREFMGIERTTFIIDQAGVVRRVFPKVKVNGHTEEVMEALREIG
jgi:thioredoxin-dependent peroxiredoxin